MEVYQEYRKREDREKEGEKGNIIELGGGGEWNRGRGREKSREPNSVCWLDFVTPTDGMR